jgi:DNA modification methylase/ParB-like chromosome segregation protein Spo0J
MAETKTEHEKVGKGRRTAERGSGGMPRLVRISPDAVRPNPWNPNVVPAHRLDALVRTARHDGSLLSVPLVRPHPDGQGYEILDGQHRWEAARQAGLAEISVLVIDATDEEARARTVAMNQIRGEPDPEKQAALLGELARCEAEAVAALADVGAEPELSLADVLGFDAAEWKEAVDVRQVRDDGFDPAAALAQADALGQATRVQTGEIWALGEHRLACGDALDAELVTRLFDGQRCRLVWTDPPYGVQYQTRRREQAPGYGRKRPRGATAPNEPIEGDDLKGDARVQFLRAALTNAAAVAEPGAAIYLACGAGPELADAILAFEGSGFEYHWQLVWVKDQFVLCGSGYHFRHENILYGWKADAGHYFTLERTLDSVFEVPRPRSSDEHPTVKPVALVAEMVQNSSQPGDAVFDPFLGSGTTIMACEATGRRGYGIEIDPRYCGVASARWEAETGISAVLVESHDA